VHHLRQVVCFTRPFYPETVSTLIGFYFFSFFRWFYFWLLDLQTNEVAICFALSRQRRRGVQKFGFVQEDGADSCRLPTEGITSAQRFNFGNIFPRANIFSTPNFVF